MTTDDHASSSPDAAVSNPAANPNHASKQRRLSGEIAAAIEQGQLKPDTAQAKAIEALADILDELHSPKQGNKKSALGW